MNWSNIHCARRRGTNAENISFSHLCPVLCPTIPWLDHKGLADGTFFFVWSGLSIILGSNFPFPRQSCCLSPLPSDTDSSNALLPAVMETRSCRTSYQSPVAYLESWCSWAWRRGGLSSVLFVLTSSPMIPCSGGGYLPGTALTSTVATCCAAGCIHRRWKSWLWLLDQSCESNRIKQISCNHLKHWMIIRLGKEEGDNWKPTMYVTLWECGKYSYITFELISWNSTTKIFYNNH